MQVLHLVILFHTIILLMLRYQVVLMELIFEQLDLNYEDYKDLIEEKMKEGKVDVGEASEILANTPTEDTGLETEEEVVEETTDEAPTI